MNHDAEAILFDTSETIGYCKYTAFTKQMQVYSLHLPVKRLLKN